MREIKLSRGSVTIYETREEMILALRIVIPDNVIHHLFKVRLMDRGVFDENGNDKIYWYKKLLYFKDTKYGNEQACAIAYNKAFKIDQIILLSQCITPSPMIIEYYLSVRDNEAIEHIAKNFNEKKECFIIDNCEVITEKLREIRLSFYSNRLCVHLWKENGSKVVISHPTVEGGHEFCTTMGMNVYSTYDAAKEVLMTKLRKNILHAKQTIVECKHKLATVNAMTYE